MKAHEPARFRRERVGGDDVHDHVDHAAGGDREDEYRREQHDARRARCDREERAPQCHCAGQRDTGTPPVGERTAENGNGGRRADAGREQQAKLRVGEIERALDVNGRDRPRTGEQPEYEK